MIYLIIVFILLCKKHYIFEEINNVHYKHKTVSLNNLCKFDISKAFDALTGRFPMNLKKEVYNKYIEGKKTCEGVGYVIGQFMNKRV